MATLNLTRHRFYNNDGTLANGGKVYTYAAGTSTPVATYTTAAATVQNTNPIILDAKGECDLWVTGVIKVNLLQSDNTQVTGYPVDNINYPSVTVWSDRGNFNASVNTFPTTGGSGISGAIKAGDFWTISVEATGGSLDAYAAGTTVRALVDTPAQTAGNWAILDVGLGPSNASAAASAAAAAASAANALTSENNAATSETNAGTSETNAALSEAAALAYAQAMSLNSTQDTSASSVAIGTGAKTFTVTAGKSFIGGMFLVIADTAAPSTNSMYGQITSYSGTTLIVNVLSVLGSGTKTAWTISQTSAANLNVDTATNCTNSLYAVGGKNARIATDTNLQTWADALPAAGAYVILISVAQGNLPAGTWYVNINRNNSDAAGALYHSLQATPVNTADAPNGTVYHNTCVNGVWSGWEIPASATLATNAGTSGTFTATGTGFTSSPTTTAAYSINNGVVHLIFNSTLSATSNATSFTITGMPVAARPSGSRNVLALCLDNTANVLGYAVVESTGVITLYPGVGIINWTSSGTKGIYYQSLTYSI